MAKPKLKRVNATPGFVTYLRTSDEDVQAPERGHRRRSDETLRRD